MFGKKPLCKTTENTKKAIFRYDYTGIMAQPWLKAGYRCYSFDGQYPEGVNEVGNHIQIGKWFDPNEKLYLADSIAGLCGSGVQLVFGFPECTDLTVAGARHFEAKRKANPLFQLETTEIADLVRCVGVLLDCP